jgi:hypothetical protein
VDPFTLSLLTNREVLEMCRYGENAAQLERTEDHAVWISRGGYAVQSLG